ncbi:MAG: hypothetical protein CM1200mP31_2850 [Candidatus Neomarinimicrobiota bacterium]|nr:MAG: hypothetical protein CM1200mP31_2850 [Candidatus Neomarinimicrobiota bacterium]
MGYANHFNLELDPFYATSGSYVDVVDGNRELISNRITLTQPMVQFCVKIT